MSTIQPPSKPHLSLLVTYRNRSVHLTTQIAWWTTQCQQSLSQTELILIEVDEAPSTWVQAAIHGTSIRYVHSPCVGPFHKTKALNVGLSLAQGELVTPFDVDLIPVGDTLLRHLHIAERSPHLLVTGYRVMADVATVNVNDFAAVLERAAIAPEDMPTALWKHLLRHERFGVVPLFQRQRLMDIGGWDEAFVGWGGEDQDMIERYLAGDRTLCRCPELVYLHLDHDRDSAWADPALIDQNRQHYYAKLHQRMGPDFSPVFFCASKQ